MQFVDRKGNLVEKPQKRHVGRRQSAYGIYLKGEQVLLVKPPWSERWEFPGGGVERNESITEGLVREFKEETGLDVIKFNPRPLVRLKQNFYADDLDEYFRSELFFFLIDEVKGASLSTLDKEEISAIEWLPIENLKEENCKGLCLNLLKQSS